MMRIAKGAVIILALAMAVACTTARVKTKAEGGRRPAEINTQLGLAYMEQGKRELALQKFRQALEIDPEYPAAHHYIAELYRQLGKSDEADKHYHKALGSTPDDPLLNNNYGVFLCQRDKPVEAVKYFLKAAKQPFYRTPEVAYKNAGLCSMKIPDYAHAEEYLRAALGIDPKLAPALFGMAVISQKQERYLLARAFLQRYFAVEAPTAQSLWLGVQIESKLGDKVAMNKYSKQLKDKFPDAEETTLLMRAERK